MSPHFFFFPFVRFLWGWHGPCPFTHGVFARLCGWLVWLGLCVGVATAHAQAVAVSTALAASLPTLLPHGAERAPLCWSRPALPMAVGCWAGGGCACLCGAAQQLGIRPVLAGRVGRWMVSTSSARRLAGTTLAEGISTSVASTDRWSVGLGLRLTHGRDSADSPLLQELARCARLAGGAGFGAVCVVASLAAQWRHAAGCAARPRLRASGGLRGGIGPSAAAGCWMPTPASPGPTPGHAHRLRRTRCCKPSHPARLEPRRGPGAMACGGWGCRVR